MRGFRTFALTACAVLLAAGLTGALQQKQPPAIPAAPSIQEAALAEQNRWYGTASLRLFEQNMAREIPEEAVRKEFAGSYFEEDGRVKIGIVGEENLAKYQSLLPKDRQEDGILSLECKHFSKQELTAFKEQLDSHFFEWELSHTAVDIQRNCVMILVKSEAIRKTVVRHLAEEFPHADPAAFHIEVNPHRYATLEAY